MMRSAILGASFAQCKSPTSIYFESAGGTRISQTNNKRAHRDIIRTRRQIISAIRGTDLDHHLIHMAISEGLHKLEAKCLIQEQSELVEEIKLLRRELGAPRYQGILSHRIMCKIFGLRTKMQFSQALRNWLSPT
jgi:hypothetical protein